MAVSRWRWLVSAAALAALTVGSSLGTHHVPAMLTYVASGHVVPPESQNLISSNQPLDTWQVFAFAKGGRQKE